MSRTLAHVGADQVYPTPDGCHVWKDRLGTVIYRLRDGRIVSMRMITANDVPVVGECLGSSADEPWRKADAPDTTAMIADLQRRVAELEKRPSVPEGFVKNCTNADYNFEHRIKKLEYAAKPKIGEVRLQSEPTPPPASPTQPPDVAVYEHNFDGVVRRYEVIDGSASDYEQQFPGFNRTVLDAFDRLTEDELWLRWRIEIHLSRKSGLWHVSHAPDGEIDEYVQSSPTHADALTAARDIARKEGWR